MGIEALKLLQPLPVAAAEEALTTAAATGKPLILGLDAGPTFAGWAVLAPPGSLGSQSRPRYVACGHALNDEVLALVRAHHGPFALEKCFWQPKLKNGKQLLETARTEGDFRGHIRALWPNASLVELSSRDWRFQLGVGAASKNANIHRALNLFVDGMPGPLKTNEHGRDALGLAVVASRILGRQWR